MDVSKKIDFFLLFYWLIHVSMLCDPRVVNIVDSRLNKLIKGHMHHFDAEVGDSPFQKKGDYH
jgi:hypothetical protein